jgi:sigma-B regulation protein RsbU (phosphoserine phosphatase)
VNPPRILVVDDEAGMLRSVERVLGHDYKVATTRNPREALELAKTFHPDLAILDIQMPEMDGFDLMEKLQAIDPQLDIILMTGSIHELDAKLIRAIRKEAFYFLQKPFDREVLLTLVERCLELRRLDRVNRKHLQRMEKELAEARAFQQSLLPAPQERLAGISVFARYIPCSELAGDFYDYMASSPDSATLLVADVSGHGASAAMLTGIVKSAFHSAGHDGYEPGSVAERVSNGIRAFDHHHFITLICVRVRKGALEFVNAGHPPGILRKREASTVLLKPTGPLITPAFASSSWEQHTIPIQAHDRIVLFTDGLIEAESESEMYGMDRLIEHVMKDPVSGGVLLDQILDSARIFAAGRPIHDDLTLVAADVPG